MSPSLAKPPTQLSVMEYCNCVDPVFLSFKVLSQLFALCPTPHPPPQPHELVALFPGSPLALTKIFFVRVSGEPGNEANKLVHRLVLKVRQLVEHLVIVVTFGCSPSPTIVTLRIQ